MTPTRSHASADSYDPFEDTRGPVSRALHFDVERIPGSGPGEPARFRKTIKTGVGDELLRMIHRENMLLMEMAARRLAHVAQSLEFTRPSSDTPFVVTTLDAGPSLNLWRGYHFARLGDAAGLARPLLAPSVFVRLMQQLLMALREFHDAGFIHCDIHAGNICLPFERQDGAAAAVVRPLFGQLRLIDFGHTLSTRLKLDEPLCLDPDAAESLRRVSPAFRAALRSDNASQRADEVNKLDFRLDLHAMGALGAQLLGSVDWSGQPQAVALQPAIAASVAALLVQDCDGAAPQAGLHERLLRPLDELVASLGPPVVDWLLPRRRDPESGSASPETARETPLIVARPTPMALPVVLPAAVPAAVPFAVPVAAPVVVPVTAPTAAVGNGTMAPAHAGPAHSAPAPRAPARRQLVLWSLGGAALLAGAWAIGNLGGPAPRPAAPAKAGVASRPPATAPNPAPSLALTPRQLEEHLDSMLNGAASGAWTEVESVTRQISAATSAATPRGTTSLVAAGQRAIEGADYQTAASTLRRATEQTPDDWKAWSALGYAGLRLGQLREAKTALTRSLRLRPQDASAWAHLGEVFALQDQKPAAAKSLRLAVYFSTQRVRTLAHLRESESTLIGPQFQAVIGEQGSQLDRIPERVP